MEEQSINQTTTETKTFKHGRNGYHLFKCRCDICYKAESQYRKEYRKRRFDSGDFAHGKMGYRYGCRCDVCKKSRMCERRRNDESWLRDGFRHGRNGYENYGCRCSVCRGAIAKHQREWQAKNREKVRAKDKKRYADSPEKYQIRARRWKFNNKEKARENQRRYMLERLRSDMSFRILQNLRGRMRKAIGRGDKAARTVELVGCSIEALKHHFENHFRQGMSWDNYGEWHIDHIIPCAAFDLSNPTHQKACFNWQNMQPLWRKENRNKWDIVAPGVDVSHYISKFDKIQLVEA